MHFLRVNAQNAISVCVIILLVPYYCSVIKAKPSLSDKNRAWRYLQAFGYETAARPAPMAISDRSAFVATPAKTAIMSFQSFAGLPRTGVLDAPTMRMMATPRCGVTDKTRRRRKRFVLQRSRWRIHHLKYAVTKYASAMSRAQVDSNLHKAFQHWSSVSPLTFSPAGPTERVHIEIRFESGEARDDLDFGAEGGVLAKAEGPGLGGGVTFDDAEKWSAHSQHGTNFLQVATHELGHSLGLSHSSVKDSLMAPFYKYSTAKVTLHHDDINGIQKLYGKPAGFLATPAAVDAAPSVPLHRPTQLSTPARPPPRPISTASTNQLCRDASVDSIVTLKNNKTYVFKGDAAWQLTDFGIADGSPRRVSDVFAGLAGAPDAAFTTKSGLTYFFKGSLFWRYQNYDPDSGYPKRISENFFGVPDHLDAAVRWQDGAIHFFKGNDYLVLNTRAGTPAVDAHRLSDRWRGMSGPLDAAHLHTNGIIYLFKSGRYWRIDKDNVEGGSRPVGPLWFGCQD